MVLQTVPIDGSLIADYKIDEIINSVSLVSGERFSVGAHGEWFTESELKAIEGAGWNAVHWVGGAMPNVPPR
jgi:hypothetical protein